MRRLLVALFAVAVGVVPFQMDGEQNLAKVADLGVPAIKSVCGDYFSQANEAVITAWVMKTVDGKINIAGFLMQIANVEVRIDNKKPRPTLEVAPGPKFIIRLSRADYQKVSTCLPRPSNV